jgi:hypothetical protein
MPRLFHVSDTPGITRFEPRLDRHGEPRVWAIADSHLVNYLLPRQCPRVTFHKAPQTTKADTTEFLEDATHVVAIEEAWLGKAIASRLVVYEMPEAPFALKDESAGYYTSSQAVEPIAESMVDQPLKEIEARGAQIRVLPCLWQLREQVAASTLGFSIIRFRNAQPPPEGFESRFPVAR